MLANINNISNTRVDLHVIYNMLLCIFVNLFVDNFFRWVPGWVYRSV